MSDAELLDAIVRDLRTIYADIIKAPLPDHLASVLTRLEAASDPEETGRGPSGPNHPGRTR